MDDTYSELSDKELEFERDSFLSKKKRLKQELEDIDTELIGVLEEIRRRRQKYLEENR